MNVILSSAWVQMRQSIARPMFRFCVFINPIFSGFLLGMMYQNKNLEDFMLYAFVGSGMAIFWRSICFSSASDIDREKWMGTLPILFTSPIGFKIIILGKILGNTIWGIFSFSLNMLVVYVIFGFPIYLYSTSYFFAIAFLTVVSMVSISFLLCSLFTLSRKVRVLMNFIEFPMMILTGMLFPINILPDSLKYISYLISPTWTMIGFKLSIHGGNILEMIVVLFILTIITVIYFIISILLFKRIEVLCRIHGSLEVF